MANNRWLGGAPAQAQVSKYVFNGVSGASPGFVGGDTITFKYINQNYTSGAGIAFSYTLTSGDASSLGSLVSGLQVAYSGLDPTQYPMFAEQLVSGFSTSGVLLLGSQTPGKPFRCSLTHNSASGSIDGLHSGAFSNGSEIVLNNGPNDWRSSGNWSTGSYPVTDSVFLDTPAAIKYNLDVISGSTLAALNIAPGFTNAGGSQLGLLQVNIDGTAYPEYRSTNLQAGITTLTVNTDCTLMRFDCQAVAVAANILGTGIGSETNPPLEALLIKGTSSTNVLNVFAGQVGSAILGGEAASWSAVTIDGGSAVRMLDGASFVANTVITVNGNSSLEIHNSNSGGSATTTVNSGSLAIMRGSFNIINVWAGGTLFYACSTLITTLNIGGQVTISNEVTLTVTNTNCYGNGSLTFNAHTTTFTTPPKLVGTSLQQFTINGGVNISVQFVGL